MTCQACAASSLRLTHDFNAGCNGCNARDASRGTNFHRAMKTGVQDSQYREELEVRGVTHEEVREAYRTDAANKGRD